MNATRQMSEVCCRGSRGQQFETPDVIQNIEYTVGLLSVDILMWKSYKYDCEITLSFNL